MEKHSDYGFWNGTHYLNHRTCHAAQQDTAVALGAPQEDSPTRALGGEGPTHPHRAPTAQAASSLPCPAVSSPPAQPEQAAPRQVWADSLEPAPRCTEGSSSWSPQLSLAAHPAPHLDWQVSSPVGLGLCSTSPTKGPNGNLPAFLNSLFLPF